MSYVHNEGFDDNELKCSSSIFLLAMTLATPTKLTMETSTTPRQSLSSHEKSAQRRASLGSQVILPKSASLVHVLREINFRFLTWEVIKIIIKIYSNIYSFCSPTNPVSPCGDIENGSVHSVLGISLSWISFPCIQYMEKDSFFSFFYYLTMLNLTTHFPVCHVFRFSMGLFRLQVKL